MTMVPDDVSFDEKMFMARLMHDIGNRDDMFVFVGQAIALKQTDFEKEEIALISQAFKNYVAADRNALKMVKQIAQYEKFQIFQNALSELKKSIQKVICQKCLAVVKLCENECISLAETSESKVVWHKIIGDYYRYAAEAVGPSAKNYK